MSFGLIPLLAIMYPCTYPLENAAPDNAISESLSFGLSHPAISNDRRIKYFIFVKDSMFENKAENYYIE